MPSLDDDPRIAALMGGPLGWHTLVHRGEVTSTNDVALALVRDGLPPGLVVVADHQSAGRGRLGRPWRDASRSGDVRSLTSSAVVTLPEAEAPLAPLAVGLAVADALRRAGANPRLKWPNDVLVPVGGALAKTAGILVERHRVATTDVLVVGTGIDLDWRQVERRGAARAWTSVAESTGTDVDRTAVLADLLRALAVWLRSLPTDPLTVLSAYRDTCATLGADVRVTFADGAVLVGRAVDLDRRGRLVVASEASGPIAVTAGDVEHVRPGGTT